MSRQIRYQIETGVAPFTATIFPADAPNQYPESLGTYSFDNLSDGAYTLTVTDANGCFSVNNVPSIEVTTTTTTSGGFSDILNLYNDYGVMSEQSGLEPTVIVENGLVRVWYTFEDYIDATYAPGGVNYGTVIYPFINVRIMYKEISTSAFESAVLAGTNIAWSDPVLCVSGITHTYVAKGPDGKYNLLGVNTTTNLIDHWQSDTGNGGTWTKITANIGVFDTSYALGNCSFYWNGSSWDVFQEFAKWGVLDSWRGSYWNGPALNSLTRMDSDVEPAIFDRINKGSSVGDIQKVQYNNKWVIIGHDSNNTTYMVPTDLTLYSSDQKHIGWVFRKWILKLSDVSLFNGDAARPYNSDSQLADPVVFEVNNRTYIIYASIWKQSYDIPALSVAWWNSSLTVTMNGLLEASPDNTYDSFLSSAFNSVVYEKITGGNGTVTENALGEQLYSDAVVGSLSGVKQIEQIVRPTGSEKLTITINAQLNSGESSTHQASVFHIFQSATSPAAGTFAEIGTKRILFAGLTSASAADNRSPIYAVDQADVTSVLVRVSTATLTAVEYSYIIEMTSTQVQVRIVRTGTGAQLATTGWKTFGSDVKDDGVTPLWLVVGAIFTDTPVPITFFLRSITKITI